LQIASDVAHAAAKTAALLAKGADKAAQIAGKLADAAARTAQTLEAVAARASAEAASADSAFRSLAAAYARQEAHKIAKIARATVRVLKKIGHVVRRAAVAVAKAAYKYSGAQDVVSCVTHPSLAGCAKAALTVALTVGTAGEGEVAEIGLNAAEHIAENVGTKAIEEGTPIYRGLAKNHNALQDAEKGIASPGDVAGHADVYAHNAGDTWTSRRKDYEFESDSYVTFREVLADEVMKVLGDGGEDPVLRACIAALRLHPRPSYAIGGTPADVLRETLEVKYRIAASHGKTFIGDVELLLRLQELGSEPVAMVSAHHAGRNFFVYVHPLTLQPVGAVIMNDALSDEVANG
jgi:hypothetical protein